MRTTVDIPDTLYRELKIRAAIEGSTIKEIILQGVIEKLRNPRPQTPKEGRPRFPTIPATNPGSLQLGDEGVYEYIPFP
jgi:hypothetical protein